MSTWRFYNQTGNQIIVVSPPDGSTLESGKEVTINVETKNPQKYIRFGYSYSYLLVGSKKYTNFTGEEGTTHPRRATLTLTAEQTASFSGDTYLTVATETTDYFEIFNGVENTVTTPQILKDFQNGTLNITITAKEGYYFKTAPTLQQKINRTTSNIYRTLDIFTTTESDHPTTYTCNVNISDYAFIDFFNTIVGETATLTTKTYSITNNVANSTPDKELTGLTCGQEITINLTANDGYYFSEAPTLNCNDGLGGVVNYSFTTTQETNPTLYTLTLTAEQTSNLNDFTNTINGATAEIPVTPVTYSITNSIAHTSTIPSDLSALEVSTEVTITITANDGYYFTTAPYIESSDGMGSLNTYRFSTSESSFPKTYSLTLTSQQTAELDQFTNTIKGAVSQLKTFSIINDVANTTPDIALTGLTCGSEVTINLSANDGFYFSEAPKLECDDGMGSILNFNFTTLQETSPTLYTLTLSANDTQYLNDYTNRIKGATAETPTVETYTIKISLTNATANIDSVTEYVKGEPLEIVVTAREGYYFSVAPVFKYSVNGELVSDSLTGDGTEKPTVFTKSYTGEETANFSNTATVGGLYGEAIIIPTVDIQSMYGIIKAYAPTAEQLQAIGEVRYVALATGEVLDLGQYITSLRKLFIDLPVTTQKEAVKLGGKATGVECLTLATDKITINCGSVAIAETYNNVVDYTNTTVDLYLPFIGFRPLTTSKIMGRTLNIKYVVNVLTGDGVCCVYADEMLIETFNCNLSFEVPYKLNNDFYSSTLNIDSSYLYGFTPFVLIRTTQSITKPKYADSKEGLLNSFSGFVVCTRVDNTLSISDKEKDEINRLLTSGVYI